MVKNELKHCSGRASAYFCMVLSTFCGFENGKYGLVLKFRMSGLIILETFYMYDRLHYISPSNLRSLLLLLSLQLRDLCPYASI